jgi:hypothetical protein
MMPVSPEAVDGHAASYAPGSLHTARRKAENASRTFDAFELCPGRGAKRKILSLPRYGTVQARCPPLVASTNFLSRRARP